MYGKIKTETREIIKKLYEYKGAEILNEVYKSTTKIRILCSESYYSIFTFF